MTKDQLQFPFMYQVNYDCYMSRQLQEMKQYQLLYDIPTFGEAVQQFIDTNRHVAYRKRWKEHYFGDHTRITEGY